MRAMRVELRAIAAVVAVCGLVFGLLVTGTPHRMRAGVSMNNAYQNAAHMAMCHGNALQHAALNSKAPADNSRDDGANCPNCCLAVFMASAVLPERVATISRPLRVAATISYYAFTPNVFDAVISGAVNGARAPPALEPIS
jgi:hypothetical protein